MSRKSKSKNNFYILIGIALVGLILLTPLNLFPASLVQISTWGSSCDSGTSTSISISVDGVQTNSGSFQATCGLTPIDAIKQYFGSYFAPTNTVYVNNQLVQISPPIEQSPNTNLAQSVNIVGSPITQAQINIPISLSTTITAPLPDTNYADGSYEQLYGGFLLTDANMNVIKQATFVKANTGTFTATLQLVPTINNYFYTTMIIKQTYTFDGSWKVTQNIVAQDTKHVIVQLTPVVTVTPTYVPPTPVVTATPIPVVTLPPTVVPTMVPTVTQTVVPTPPGNTPIDPMYILIGVVGIVLIIVVWRLRK